jgi:hypothetical protein
MRRFTGKGFTDVVPKVTLAPHLYHFLDAFNSLDTERDLANFHPIPESAVYDYARRYGLNFPQFEELLYVIRELDNVAISIAVDKANKRIGKP